MRLSLGACERQRRCEFVLLLVGLLAHFYVCLPSCLPLARLCSSCLALGSPVAMILLVLEYITKVVPIGIDISSPLQKTTFHLISSLLLHVFCGSTPPFHSDNFLRLLNFFWVYGGCYAFIPFCPCERKCEWLVIPVIYSSSRLVFTWKRKECNWGYLNFS